MATVIHNTIIVTSDPEGRIIYDGAIAIGDDGNIAAVGATDEVVQAHPNAEMVSGRGKAVYPGFFNCHTHLTATLSRGILEDLRLSFSLALSRTSGGNALGGGDASIRAARRN